ncbi:MAG: hypothetical protein DMD53_09895 [Gemmatimonadetes bacterium]|nr:MAG: hypothetical protein DMD53_09895 [Gemmatimonadota bacterium]
MRAMRCRHLLWTLPAALAAGILGCEQVRPTQPSGAATKLAFTGQPTNVAAAQPITPAVQVAVQDAVGNSVPGATDAVTVTLGSNPSGGTLGGTMTVSAVQGIATFADLRIDRPGSGYTLGASAAGLSGATSTPFAVTLTFAAVTASGLHTCGLTIVTGAAYCWGANGSGQLGDGTMTNRSSPVLVQAPAGVSFAAVTGGDLHTCGLATGLSAAAYCWGGNGSGQLGDGTMTSRSSPVLVQAPAGVSFAAVTGGAAHTCGLTTGLSAAAYCWGGNGSGQLGDGTMTSRSSPVLVQAPAGVSFAAVTAGAAHTCGVTAAGTAYCWGDNGFGQLGDGTTTSQSSPVLVQAPPGVSFAAVTGGVADTCGVTAAGIAYCWGRNLEGQLGDGTTTNRLTPVLVQAPAGVSLAAVGAGDFHTCGVTATGAAYCWGANGSGQLGDGTNTTNRLTPVLVQAPAGVSFAAVTAGAVHTCGVTAAGTAYCWGRNVEGQLGDGTTTDRLTPVRVVQ